MTEILYVGHPSQLTGTVSTLLRGAGYRLVLAQHGEALRRLAERSYAAVVLCWISYRSAYIAKSAQELGTPVIVIAVPRRLVEAFESCGSFAEVFVEQPANGDEVATLAVELAKLRELALQNTTAVAAAA